MEKIYEVHMEKIYEVHVTTKTVNDPVFYFVEIATGKRYEKGKYPDGFKELDLETKNDIVVFIAEEGGHDEKYGSYYFTKHFMSGAKFLGMKLYPDFYLGMKLTKYGEECELEEHIRQREKELSESALG